MSPSTTAPARAPCVPPAARSSAGSPTASRATRARSTTPAAPRSAPAPRCRSSYDGFRGLPRRPRGGAGRAEASRRRRPSDARRGRRARAGDSAARLRRRARGRGAARAHHARRRRGGARRAARGQARPLPSLAAGRRHPAKPPRRLVVERRPERAVRAWLSGIDGTGSRAVWVLFEGGFGGATLCSLIVNDTAGILDVAGGDITKKRLEEELKSLRASQKLPWIAVEPARALRAVVEALTLHATLGTTPPAAFDRWKAPFERARGLHAGAGGPRPGPPA